MFAPLSKFIDWSVIQSASAVAAAQITFSRKPPDHASGLHLEEALQFLNGPDFLAAESQPAQLAFHPDNSGLHFRFPTPRPCAFPQNNVVHGHLYRCPSRWQERPAIVLLHGINDSLSYRFRYPFIARHCNRAGFNAALLAAPYHFQRRPRNLRALSRPDYLRLAESTAQAVAEIRALTGWLLAQGCPTVALWGSSYGGWLAGLTASRDTRLASIVLTKPAVRLTLALAKLLVWRRLRQSWLDQHAAFERLNLTPLNLTLAKPSIPKENILLIEGIHDLFVPKETIEDLWQSWGQPEIWRLPHAHISLSLTPGLTARVLNWLAPHLHPQLTRSAA
jgi:pimeloyl-ACP methyl ester carboxylesterase